VSVCVGLVYFLIDTFLLLVVKCLDALSVCVLDYEYSFVFQRFSLQVLAYGIRTKVTTMVKHISYIFYRFSLQILTCRPSNITLIVRGFTLSLQTDDGILT
jgi:hypothetical protein